MSLQELCLYMGILLMKDHYIVTVVIYHNVNNKLDQEITYKKVCN